MVRVEGMGCGVIRSILETQDAVLTIPGHDVSFFPQQQPQGSQRLPGELNLNSGSASWILLLDAVTLELMLGW